MTRGRRPEHSREMILTKGMELFNRRGYHGTGIKEILDACQVPKGSFYNFFASKEQFAIEIIEHYWAIEFERWQQEMDSVNGTHLEKIYHALALQTQQYAGSEDKVGCLLANLSGEIAQASPSLRAALRTSTAKVMDVIEADMRICQQEGSVRGDFTPRELAEMIWDHWQGAVLRMKVDNCITPLQSHCRNLIRLIEHPNKPTTQAETSP